MPVDDMYGLDELSADKREHQSYRQFVEEWKRSMEEAFKLANANIDRADGYNKKQYDRKIHGVELKEKDKVLLRNMREKGGTGKLRSHFERGMFEIIKKRENLPVYVIRNLYNEKDIREVHRSKLLECNDLPKTVFEEMSAKKIETNEGQKINKRKEVVIEADANDDIAEDVVMFLHEDVADLSLEGGDGLGDSQEVDDEVEGDDPVDETEEEPKQTIVDPDQDDEEIQPTRQSRRQVRKKKIFSYDAVGGPPVLVDISAGL